MEAQELGNRFATIREQQGFSQKQVANFLGISVEQLDEFEKGKMRIGVSVLEKSCDLFGCSLFMMTGHEEMCTLPKISNACNLEVEDMKGLCAMNRIALNLRKMNSIHK